VVAREVTRLACLNRRLIFHGRPGDFLGDAALAALYGPTVRVVSHDALDGRLPEFLAYDFMQRAFGGGCPHRTHLPRPSACSWCRGGLSLIARHAWPTSRWPAWPWDWSSARPRCWAPSSSPCWARSASKAARARGALAGDASLAVFLSGGFAFAVVLISLARGFNADLFAVLFGSHPHRQPHRHLAHPRGSPRWWA
jgi:hypothetical protein